MGISFDKETNTWSAYFSKRHPITRKSKNLRRIGLKSQAEARRVEKILVIELEERFRQSLLPNWSALISQFLEDMRSRGLLERTIQTYELCLRAHTEKWNDRLVDQITAHDIRVLIQDRVGAKSIAHQQNLVKFIKGAFQCAVERGHLKTSPMPQFRFKTPDRVKKVLTADQVRVLLDKAHEWSIEWYPHWAVAVYTGLRSGELYALTWENVNFELKQITVAKAWNSKDGFKSTKSGHERIVPINDPLILVLKELKLAGEGGPYVLPRNTKWDKGEQARELRKFLIMIGLPPVRFHDLRATWATILLGKGVPPAQVMKMGGWRDMKTMMIYMRMAGIDVQGATDCLDFHDPVRTTAKVLSFAETTS